MDPSSFDSLPRLSSGPVGRQATSLSIEQTECCHEEPFSARVTSGLPVIHPEVEQSCVFCGRGYPVAGLHPD